MPLLGPSQSRMDCHGQWKASSLCEPLRLQHCGHDRSWYGCRDLGNFQDSVRCSFALCLGDRSVSEVKKASSFAIAGSRSPLGRISRRVRSVCGFFDLCDPCGHCYRRAHNHDKWQKTKTNVRVTAGTLTTRGQQTCTLNSALRKGCG